ncbi:MAG: ATP-binding cassette domain-containing protein [Gaiellaceae bacterium]
MPEVRHDRAASRVLTAEAITKRFGHVEANNDVSFSLRSAEVHALLGQNGAGKSTLVGILSGSVVPDGGRVCVDGEAIALGSPQASNDAGIATVYQDLVLVPTMTGLENIALALRRAPNAATRDEIAASAAEFELPVNINTPVGALGLPERQRIELLRALCQRPAFLLLDEPTSLLPPLMVETFLGKVRELADRQLAVLLITHRLDEARLIADRVTILRDGQVVAEFDRDALPPNEDVARLIVGQDVAASAAEHHAREHTVLAVADLVVSTDGRAVVNGVSLGVKAGEIVGIAGVDGNGQRELMEAIAGLRAIESGTVAVEGNQIQGQSYADCWSAGVQFVSEDRRREGIVPTYSIAEHFSITPGRFEPAKVRAILERYDVRPPDPKFRADQLSGGNQQKMLMARACEAGARVLLVAYPTQGLDVQATVRIRDILIEQAASGIGIVVTSSDLDELLAISQRVVVMSRGQLVGAQHHGAFDKRELAEWIIRGPGGFAHATPDLART